MLIYVLRWLITIIAVEAVVEIFVQSEIFIKVRIFFSKLNPSFLGKLFTCGYCMSVWVSATIAWTLPGTLTEYQILDIIIKTFVLHRLSNVLHEALSRWFKRLPFELVFYTTQNQPPSDDVIITEKKEDGKG